ncbi:MAG: NTP transferase domain-containing protein [Actinomycetota bacterium]|nr:NTP transferase domain-containing protein [Actinomycetota bacterium]
MATRAPAAPRSGVVLAAGRSERLSRATGGRSKALTQLGGVPLVERAVRTLFAAGLERVVVVVGYQADEVSVAARLAGSNVEVVRADSWEQGNGASLAAALPAMAGERQFVVLCGDHAFADGALKELVATGGPAVLVDRSPAPEAWAEGMRVRIEDGSAVAFRKDLDEPAIDCGVFVLPPEVFDAQREAAQGGDHSLAGAVTALGRRAPIRAVSLPGGVWWQDVDTPANLRVARTLVRRSLAKESDGPVSRHLNRPVSTRISMTLAPLRLAPHLLSILTFLVGLWAAWSLSASRALVGGLFVQAASVLDGVDGETARLHDRTSRWGAFLDDVLDRMVDAAIVAGLWLWVWNDPSRKFRVLIIAMSSVGWAGIHLAGKKVLPGAHRALALTALVERRSFGVLLGSRDVRLFLVAGAAVADQPWLALAAFAVSYFGSFLWRIFTYRRRPPLAPPSVPAPHQIGESPHGNLYEVG